MKGIPYMGSKRRIAPELILHMANAAQQASSSKAQRIRYIGWLELRNEK